MTNPQVPNQQMTNQQGLGQQGMNNSQSKGNPTTKFWGIWLPVPTVIGIIVAIVWTYLILGTVGYTEGPIEKAGEKIIEQF